MTTFHSSATSLISSLHSSSEVLHDDIEFRKINTAANQPNDCLAVCSSDIYLRTAIPKRKFQALERFIIGVHAKHDLRALCRTLSDQL